MSRRDDDLGNLAILVGGLQRVPAAQRPHDALTSRVYSRQFVTHYVYGLTGATPPCATYSLISVSGSDTSEAGAFDARPRSA